jgi:hypothetical protein
MMVTAGSSENSGEPGRGLTTLFAFFERVVIDTISLEAVIRRRSGTDTVCSYTSDPALGERALRLDALNENGTL